MVEFAIASSVLFAMLFGIIELGMALYCYTFVSEAAREASRYAAVRGQNSCSADVATDGNCNLGPVKVGSSQTAYTTQPLQTWVQALPLPFAQNMTVTATWWAPTVSSGHMVWTTSCTTEYDTSSSEVGGAVDGTTGGGTYNQCNLAGHAVQVQVSYPFPLAIPFVMNRSVTVHSTSTMVINM